MPAERSELPVRTRPVRWLSNNERAAWLRLVALTAKLPSALDAQLQRDSGLTLFEYTVLAVLSEQPRRTIRMSQLAIIAEGSLSRLSHAAAKLERAGLLARQPCPVDGRYTNAILTERGYERVLQAAPHHVATVRNLVFDPLSQDQVEQLREAAEAILVSIDGAPWPAGTTARTPP